ncbi:MAG: AAA family ATPase [Candidatus Thorarchaeota archaeon]|nr:AAA family ATPase [Candidatus Thorarchaeota archaeon]
MRLTRVIAHDFKCFKKIDVKMDNLTVLVGPNASGKSSFIDIFAFVSNALSESLRLAIRSRGGYPSIVRAQGGGRRPQDIMIELELESVSKTKYRYGIEIGTTSEYEFIVKSEWLTKYLSDEEHYLFHSENGEWVVAPSEGKFRPPKIDLAISKLSEDTEIHSVHEFLQNMFVYRIHPDLLRRPQKTQASERLKGDGSNIASILLRMTDEESPLLKEMLSDLKALIPEIEDIAVNQVTGYPVIFLKHKIDDKEFYLDLSQESDGTIRIIGLLTAIYQDPPPTVLGIEEPEIAVHPKIMAALAEILDETSDNMQVILTTHSPELMNRFPIDTIRVVEKQDGVAHIGTINKKQRKIIEQRLYEIGELLLIDDLKRTT